MSTAAASGISSDPQQSHAAAMTGGFGNVLRSEWTKLRSVRSTLWTLLATLIVTVGLSAAICGSIVASWDDVSATDKAQIQADPAGLSLAGFILGQLAICVLGVMVVSSEYTTGMIRTSLTAVPRRGPMLAAKALLFAVIAFVTGFVVSLIAFLVGQLILSSKDLDTSLGEPGVLRVIVGGGLYLVALGLMSLALGAILRHTAGAISTIVGILLVVPIIGSFLPGDWGDAINKYLPSNVAAALISTTPQDNRLGPWSGYAVLCGYVAVVLVVAFTMLRRRDA
jgi:ABC-type transport system involved in multi-copper enzyme maturation permease subunit